MSQLLLLRERWARVEVLQPPGPPLDDRAQDELISNANPPKLQTASVKSLGRRDYAEEKIIINLDNASTVSSHIIISW